MFLIRPAQARDTERILKIWLEASMQAHHFIAADFWNSQLMNMRDIYLPLAENHVIEQHGTVTGFCSLLKSDAFLAALFIDPAIQSQGHGSALIDFLQQKVPELNLQVYSENTQAIRFYQKKGFTVAAQSIDEHTGHAQTEMCWFVKNHKTGN